MFNLSNRVLTDLEIKVLEKGLYFAPIQRKINEPELRQDFADFVDKCTQSGFLEMNLHHSLVKFLLFLQVLLETSKRPSQPAGIFKPIGN